MKISEAISHTRSLSGNAVDDNTLCRWLSELDGRLMLDFYKGSEWMSYSLPQDEDHELLVPFPWDELYVHYLEAMVYYSNGEFERYRNSYEMYNKKELDYRQWYARNQLPITLEALKRRDCTVVTEGRGSKPFWYLSAYALAVKHGYTGTEEEWLAELVGPEGPPGQDGRDGQDGQDGQDGKDGQDGAEGPQGRPGAAAGFGQVTATVDDTGGTPAVEVEASGPDTAKNFHFSFTGLKGQQGDQGASFTALEKTAGTGAPGTTDTYTAYNSEGTAAGTIQVYNGADGLGTGDFKADGTVPMTGSLQMGGKQITGMAEPTQDADGATKSYVDNSVKNVSVTTDPAPTQDSANPVQSGGVYTALAGKADTTLSNLSNYQKALHNIGGRPNRNLLDNAYLKGGGSQQGGGQFPVNQRGFMSVNSAQQPLVDRWRTYRYVSGTATVVENGITLTGNLDFGETLERNRLPDKPNIPVTISALFSDGTLVSKTQILANNQSGESIVTAINSTDNLIFIRGWNSPETDLFFFQMNSGNSVTVAAAKLELGSTQTLAHQDEDGNWQLFETPDYGEELAKCQRYYLPVDNCGRFAGCFGGTANDLQVFVPTPVTMRKNPSVQGITSLSARVYSGAANSASLSVSQTLITEGGVLINFSVTFASYNPNIYSTATVVFGQAGALSAEL